MAIFCPFEDDDIEIVPIPLDSVARRRLLSLSREAGDQPSRVAASLLSTLLREDEESERVTIECHTIQ